MLSTTYSIEERICSCVEELSYLSVRSDSSNHNVSFSRLPAAIIHPAKIISISGESRQRITMECEITAMRSCLGCSTEDIAEVYAAIRCDFAALPAALVADGNVVDVSSFEMEQIENTERPQVKAMATITLEVMVDYVESLAESQWI